MLEERPFSHKAPAITGQVAVATHDTMAGHNDRDGVGGTGARDSAGGVRAADGARDFTVRARAAVGDSLQLLPHSSLESSGLHVEGKLQMGLLAAKMPEERAHPASETVPVAKDLCRWIFFC